MSAGEHGTLDVVVLGTGPIGLAYGHRLAEAGHRVVWGADAEHPAEPPTTITFSDWGSGEEWEHRVVARPLVDIGHADLAVVALGARDWATALPAAASLPGEPTLVTLGQSPLGRRAVPESLRERTVLAFPGVTGRREGDHVTYVRLADMPTTVLRGPLPLQHAFTGSLSSEAFPCVGVDDDGWFAFRAMQSIVFASAILGAGGTAGQLGRDRAGVRLLHDALHQGLRALRASGVRGIPPADVAALSPVFAAYWAGNKARQLQADSGDPAFGVYARHLGDERAWLAAWALAVCDEAPTPTERLRELLTAS